jgi:hypothetical protein
LIAKVSVMPMVSVVPSAGARAAAVVPLAPGRFSTTTGWPSAARRPIAMPRLITSVMRRRCRGR